MKKLLIVAICFFCCVASYADTESNPREKYKLFPTKNMWTFLKLDTHTGKIWQVQFSVRGPDYRFETVLSDENLALPDRNYFDGRFTLYPTENTYNLLLLDQYRGRVWQVQWGEADTRMLLRID